MRALIVNPGMDMRKLGRFAKLLEPMPCIGPAYVASALEAHGVLVRVVDMFAERTSVERVIEVVRSWRPDLVGLTVMTPSAPVCEAISRGARRVHPEVAVVWGGVHADVFAHDIVRSGQADFVVHGDGEDTIRELVDALGSGRDLAAVAGLTWSDAGEPVTNSPRPLRTDLDALPWPAWHHFPIRRYGLLPFADLARPVLTISASRGCPYRCAYCSLLHTGRTWRGRDPMRVVDEYEHLVSRYGVRQIGFVDPIFPLRKADLVPFCREMERRGLDRRCVWLSETRADRLDVETCETLYAGGCRRILLGIESGDEELLGNVNKKLARERVREGVANLRRAGIQAVGLFMIGLPGETPEQTRRTVEFAVELDLDFAKFAITVPFPGSQMFADQWQRTLFREDWENYTTFNPDPEALIYHPEGYDPVELVRMQRWALRRFYVRPRQIWRQLAVLRTLAPSTMLRGVYGALRG